MMLQPSEGAGYKGQAANGKRASHCRLDIGLWEDTSQGSWQKMNKHEFKNLTDYIGEEIHSFAFNSKFLFWFPQKRMFIIVLNGGSPGRDKGRCHFPPKLLGWRQVARIWGMTVCQGLSQPKINNTQKNFSYASVHINFHIVCIRLMPQKHKSWLGGVTTSFKSLSGQDLATKYRKCTSLIKCYNFPFAQRFISHFYK